MTDPAQRLRPLNYDQPLTKKGDPQSVDFGRFLLQLCQIVNFQQRLIAPSSQTVTASPYTYTNNTANDQSVIVQGGTVSLIQYIRNGGTPINVGTTAGMFSLSPLDSLRVTYTVAPTITVVVR